MQTKIATACTAAALAIAIMGALAACESRKQPAAPQGTPGRPAQPGQAGLSDQQVKTFVMPTKSVTDDERARLLAAVKEHVAAAQKAEPLSFPDADWNAVQYHRLGDFYKVVVPRRKVTPHQEVIAPAYTFRLGKAFKILLDQPAN